MMAQYEVLIEHERETGMYLVSVPDLPGCRSQGTTLEDAERNAQEAIALHLEAMQIDGEPIPEPRHHVLRTVEVQV
jgi:predicted RNase H-like HicB family nuclease